MGSEFKTFSAQHFGALGVFVLFTFVIIWYGLNSSERTKKLIGFGISFIALSFMVFDSVFRLLTKTYDIADDLPLFLCDIVVLILPFMIWTQNRRWLGILYFWSLAGTFQALITPELEDGFPNFNFFRYFIMHAGIVTAVIYSIIIWRIRINWRDFFNAVIYAQVYIIGIHLVNMMLRTNYSYTMQKPDDATVLDLLGAWPWYLFWGELLMIVLFLLLMLPFLRKEKSNPDASDTIVGSQQSY